MALNANEIRLVIHLEGGIVQAVYSDSSSSIKVAIQDLDIDGADGDEMAKLDDGTEFIGHIEPIFRNDTHVARVFAAFGEEVVVTDKQLEDYVNFCGRICPVCGGGDFEGKVFYEVIGPVLCSDVGCNRCKSTWNDQYALVGFSGLEAKPLNVSPSG